ncbi:flavin monoamine oxidase family protein [Paracidobacterium acidisoli]|uniref:Tryptophan 2-monooxygenase n=1 Tax=Paracidobacterium acidisoli TaxID=2303751 RepID=A0A372ILC3_9BACT|nr:NAD(P)/FAD-dependent oxidoreductase [Paracidobacterium acidisoli]MBT9332742.1 FAD-dependent oxidoreductase [Paracidobacterium acidisoli]
MPRSLTPDILVLGAGIAGLSAARALAESGAHVALLEARDRVGGRVHSVRHPACDLPFELGAEFVHGVPPELHALIHEAGLTLFEREGEHACFENGASADCEDGRGFSLLEQMTGEPDETFAEWIAAQHAPGQAAAWLTGYVEGFNAADAGVIGTAALVKQQQAEEAIEGGRAFRVQEGYQRLAEFLCERFVAAGGELHLQNAVQRVEWQPGSVRVTTRPSPESGTPDYSWNRHPVHTTVFEAPRCVVALPLGVLQSHRALIAPDPPVAGAAFRRMAMGTAVRISLLFREAFWRDRFPDVSFFFTRDLTPGVWWTTSPRTDPVLTAWVGGPRALGIPAEMDLFQDLALNALARIFGRHPETLRPLLVASFAHDWQSDPYSRGAYSYAPKGALHASDDLAQPVEETLFFAGEHTDTTGHWGTVHGALRSGLRAASQALAPAGTARS